jgi:hypothetical protein
MFQIYFIWSNTLHVSDGLSVHQQEFKTVHTATGICQTDTVDCFLEGTLASVCQTDTVDCLLAGTLEAVGSICLTLVHLVGFTTETV